MLTISDEVIKRIQEKLSKFLWRNKKDKIKREDLFQQPIKGGLNFPNFRTAMKALRLSWISSWLLNDSNDAWKAIPNVSFNKYGCLTFFLQCNYNNTKNLDRNVSCLLTSDNCDRLTLTTTTIVTLFYGTTKHNYWRKISLLEELGWNWNILHPWHSKWTWKIPNLWWVQTQIQNRYKLY